MDKKQIQKSLNIFKKRIQTQFKPQKVVLFGSYARGMATEYSDVDIVVVSDVFKSIPAEKRLDVLYPLTKDLQPDFHVFGFTPDEYKNMSPVTSVSEAKIHGISLL